MSLSIAVYSKESFKEFILPSINNSDYELFIRKDQMKTQGDLRLVMEVVDNIWTVKGSKDYRLFVKESRYNTVDLMDGLVVNVVTKNNDNLTIISTEVEDPFHAYDKYRFSNQASITIGKDASNDISCDYLGVSREHATIINDGGIAYIDCTSKNGLYINSVRVDGRCELSFGDYINVVGLHMMYLGSLLAIDTAGKGVNVNSSKLKKINPGGSACTSGGKATVALPVYRSFGYYGSSDAAWLHADDLFGQWQECRIRWSGRLTAALVSGPCDSGSISGSWGDMDC